jgi:2-polyprenyl-3-methyl-5-hydroxy-6-metoxy-1,4-benzoquinol methylase
MQFLPVGSSVLEIGAGDGWQAAFLAQSGYLVTAVDIAVPATPRQFHQVTLYDGRSLPFADACFDAVYSSNVLEHVVDFDHLQAEIARVLRPGGIAVHCLPSFTWRALTTMTHPLYALRLLLQMLLPPLTATKDELQKHLLQRARERTIWQRMRLLLLSPRHGEHGNLLTEHWLFTRRHWLQRFAAAGWDVKRMLPSGLFYSGNEILGARLGKNRREVLAGLFGSSTVVYLVRPRVDSSD